MGCTDQGLDVGAVVVDLAVHIRGCHGFDLVSCMAISSTGTDIRFTTTVHGAYAVIGMTGFCWGLAQCEYNVSLI